MFCISLNPNHLQKIKSLEYLPVGLGDKKFSKDWYQDKTNENISQKNEYYGEYTFHYWLWKNYVDKLDDRWIGFCQYRKFFVKEQNNSKIDSLETLSKIILKNIPESMEKYDVILGDEFKVNKLKISKFVKRDLKKIILNPSLLFDNSKRNLKFHFDMWHGNGNLDKAIDLLSNEDKNNFNDFVNNNISFNPHNMFVCKSKKILKNYYNTIFPWLKKCEDLFGFNKNADYGGKRMYGFLAERFLSYWFKKNAKYKTVPIIGLDINNL